MSEYIIHDDRGRILRSGQCPATMLTLQAGAGERVMTGRATDASHYVDMSGVDRLITLRPTMAPTIPKTICAAYSAETLTISALPVPTQVSITGPASISGETITGSVDLQFDLPGAYTVRLDAFPHLPYEVVIHVA